MSFWHFSVDFLINFSDPTRPDPTRPIEDPSVVLNGASGPLRGPLRHGREAPPVATGRPLGGHWEATEYRKKWGSEHNLATYSIHSSIFGVDRKIYGRFQEASGRSQGASLGPPGASWGFWGLLEASGGLLNPLLEAFWGLRGAS